jgi:CPA2 family monovalent cation:H+ antiporter-2
MMHESSILRDLLILLAASLPIVYVSHRVRLPPLVGFLLTGLVIGPGAMGLIQDTQQVQVLAEFGVVLLLFTIGLDFSLARLMRMSRLALGCGSLQVVITLTLVTGVAHLAGLSTPPALVTGFVVALSSTAIVLKMLSDAAQIEAPHGRITVAVLLFQDLCIVPMMLLLPILQSPETLSLSSIGLTLAKAFLAIVAVLILARIVLPVLLRRVVDLRSREIFVGTVVLVCLGTAWTTAQLGFSLAIGAFIAGIVISESEYSHQVVAEALPFRDLFNSVFFISVGMLLDLHFVAENPLLVVGLGAGIMVLKTATGTAVVYPFFRSLRVAATVGILLAQVGEFSFVLADQAMRVEILTPAQFQAVLAASVLTMLVTPFLVMSVPPLLLRWGTDAPLLETEDRTSADRGHVVIVGYGLNGRNLARVLRETGIAYRILELNSDTVRTAAREGEPITFGDGTRPAVLQAVGVESAAVVVVAISDSVATRRIASLVRRLNASAALIVRTRFMTEIDELYRLGADEVIPEEFETSVEIFARVLQRFHVPRNVIDLQVELIRNEGYAIMRGARASQPWPGNLSAVLAASTTETVLIPADSHVVGHSLAQLDLRQRTGASVIAVVRNGNPFTNPSSDFVLEASDVVVFLGDHKALVAARRTLESTKEPEQNFGRDRSESI